jgi:hypothetical protein
MWGNEYLGIDRRVPLGARLDMIPAFEEETLEETERYRVFRDAQGRIRKGLKEGESEGYRMSMDQYISFPITENADFVKIRQRYNSETAARYDDLRAAGVPEWRNRDFVATVPDCGTFGLYWNLREWMGTMNLSYAFFDQPQLVHEMLDFLVEFAIDTLSRVLKEFDVDYFSFSEDFAFKTGPLVSPALFRKFFVSPYRRLTEFLRRHSINSIWLDTDGNCEILIPLLLECGVTCLWPLEQTAGMDPRKLRREYGRDLALSGGIDKRELAKGKREIEQELESKLPSLLEQGGYIPTLDHAVPPDVSLENYTYYLELKQRYLEGRHGA